MVEQFGTAPTLADVAAANYRAKDLERQIAELRAELINRVNYWSELYSKEYHRAQAAEAENRRLRALPLKDEVERVVETFAEIADIEDEVGREPGCEDDDRILVVQAHGCQLAELTVSDFCAARSLLSRLRAGEQEGWREITEDDQPPLDTDVIMGCWETLPKRHWATEIGHYGSKRGGWIHGRMTHWLPLDRLPAAPSEHGGKRL